MSFGVSFSLLRSDFSSRGTTPTAQNTREYYISSYVGTPGSPLRDQEVGGSNPLAPTKIHNDLALRWSACCTWSGSNPFAATCSYKDLALQCWTPLPLLLPVLTPRRWTQYAIARQPSGGPVRTG